MQTQRVAERRNRSEFELATRSNDSIPDVSMTRWLLRAYRLQAASVEFKQVRRTPRLGGGACALKADSSAGGFRKWWSWR